MLDSTDSATTHALRELMDIVRSEMRPVVLWIGAGASRWAGYPGWTDLAEHIHGVFRRVQDGYPVDEAKQLLHENRFPEFFSLVRQVSRERYYREISKMFEPKPLTAVYSRFGKALINLGAASILTTNVDDQLEHTVPAVTVQGVDIERAHALLVERKRFLCKLHGSVSSLTSMVLTAEDYDTRASEKGYLEYLGRMFADATVLFCGYGLADDYLLDVIRRNHDIARLFGDGPHFALLPHAPLSLPENVRVLRYSAVAHQDHRAQLALLEDLASAGVSRTAIVRSRLRDDGSPPHRETAHLLFDIYPPGTWQTAQTVTFDSQLSGGGQMMVGTGFNDEEITGARITALHDLLVGLICFDVIYAPITAVGRVHILLGSDLFWALSLQEQLRFISWRHAEGMVFRDPSEIGGGQLINFEAFNSDRSRLEPLNIIRRQLQPAPGRTREAESQFTGLANSVRTIEAAEEGSIAQITRDILMRPSIRHLIGVSEATPVDSFARWHAFTVLRVAHVAKIAAACRVLSIQSAKLDFGAAAIAGPAFALTRSTTSAADAASYVVAGRFAADLGTLPDAPRLIRAVVAFRDTNEAVALRAAVRSALEHDEGAEVALAVNAALRSMVPFDAMERARQRFVNLHTRAPQPGEEPATAFWNDEEDAGVALERWKQRFKRERERLCQERNVGPYDPCPCGSGDKLKFCCGIV